MYYEFVNAALNLREKSTDIPQLRQALNNEINLRKNAEAKIFYLSPIIQDETITSKALAELKNPNRDWYPGSLVNINIATKNVSAKVAIPKEAIQEHDGKEFIFIKTNEGFEKRSVQTGVRDSNHVEILEGLSPGEEYAVTKTFLLKADLSKKEAEHEH